MTDIARLERLIEPLARALGFDLVRVKMIASEAGDGAQALQIMAEDPATFQLTIDQCAALSRAVSEALDRAEEQGEQLVEGAYHLEVSSPGIDRPLTRSKDFEKWAGHEAKISLNRKLDGHRNLRGLLCGIDGDAVTIEDKRAGRLAVPLETIHSARLVLTDRLIAETQPLDASGAEDVIEDEQEEAYD